jgi:hypothetical protein
MTEQLGNIIIPNKNVQLPFRRRSIKRELPPHEVIDALFNIRHAHKKVGHALFAYELESNDFSVFLTECLPLFECPVAQRVKLAFVD